jgi:hypothetical protein
MGADVNPGQSHDGDGAQGKGAADWPEMWKGCGAQGDGNTGVPGQVAEPGGVAATAPGAWKQGRRPGAPHHLLDQLRECPGTGAADEEPARQLTAFCQPGGSGSRGGGAEGPQLHDGPGGQVERVGQAVDRAEHLGLTRADAVAAHGHRREQQRRSASPKPDSWIG